MLWDVTAMQSTIDSIRTMLKTLNLHNAADEGDAIYLPAFYYSEIGIAKRMKEILAIESSYSSADTEEMIDSIQKECQIQYDEVQVDAIRTAVKSKFMVLTGGPGTGKTTTTLAIIKAFQKLGASVLLAVPMGRAAKPALLT